MFAFDPNDVHLDSLQQRLDHCAKDTTMAALSIIRKAATQQTIALPEKTKGRNVEQPKSMTRDGEDFMNPEISEFDRPSRTTRTTLEGLSTGKGTPPVDIMMAPSASRSKSRARNDEEEDLGPDKITRPDHPASRTTRKKKRAQKRSAMEAVTTVRGFTPATSGDEGSDFSTTSLLNRRNLSMHRGSSVTNSPGLRSSSPSALTRQIEAMSLEALSGRQSLMRNKSKLGSETPSSESVTSEANSSDNEGANLISYEVPLEHDFISPDVCEEKLDSSENASMLDHVVRKMTASDFEPLRCLGKGSFGTVILVRQISTGKLYAQKQFSKASLIVRKQLVDQTKTERAILESINRHPFVVKLFYAFQDHEKLYLILEYAQGGELFTRMLTERMLPEETAAFYMAEMVLALEHLHHNVGVVYRDLKPENILLDSEGHLLLTDFGLSKVAVDGHHRCRSMTGTLEYMAPEVLLQQSYGTAVDWWSFGILGFDLLTGASPFRANCEAKVKEKILKQKPAMPFFMSPDARDLLTRLLRKEPKKRLGGCMPKDMEIIKKHRFFRKIDWKKLEARELEPPIRPVITDPELAENFSSEFTDLAVSPVVSGFQKHDWGVSSTDDETDPFGGFSYVASRSLLESGHGFF
ncbi:serine/threonine protein kinase psk1 [Pseudocyphellaria aurata]|nr:serine/threonine protein kinase psk1 [Pseudocyphellaria aurata]